MKVIEKQASIIISSAVGKDEKRKRINSMFDMVCFFTSTGMIFNPVRKKDIDIDSVNKIHVYPHNQRVKRCRIKYKTSCNAIISVLK